MDNTTLDTLSEINDALVDHLKLSAAAKRPGRIVETHSYR
jgi:hypothetical protein